MSPAPDFSEVLILFSRYRTARVTARGPESDWLAEAEKRLNQMAFKSPASIACSDWMPA